MSQKGTKPLVSRTQLFPCPHYVFCDTFNCRNVAKWFVGRPDGPRQCTFKLCDDCARDLSTIVPEQLRDSEYTKQLLSEELRASITQNLEVEIAEKLRGEFEAEYQAKLEAQLNAFQPAEIGHEKLPSDFIDNESSPKDDEQRAGAQVFRCLDCNFEASSPAELAAHKKEHDAAQGGSNSDANESATEPPKPKRLSPQERLAQRRAGQK